MVVTKVYSARDALHLLTTVCPMCYGANGTRAFRRKVVATFTRMSVMCEDRYVCKVDYSMPRCRFGPKAERNTLHTCRFLCRIRAYDCYKDFRTVKLRPRDIRVESVEM